MSQHNPGGGNGGFGGPPPGGFGGPPPGGPPGAPGGYGVPPAGGHPGAPGGYGVPPAGGPPGGYGVPPQNMPSPYAAPGMPPGAMQDGQQLRKEADTWLLLNIILSMTCCLPLGVAGAIYASGAKDAAMMNDVTTASDKLSTAKTCGMIGVAIGGLLIVVWVVIMLLGFAAAWM